ncbi:MAG: hypothetical protein U1B80_08955 [Anaerolineaceae bacterium]|nr:hypothetical protein [Anaerolineaceae bacterium]
MNAIWSDKSLRDAVLLWEHPDSRADEGSGCRLRQPTAELE